MATLIAFQALQTSQARPKDDNGKHLTPEHTTHHMPPTERAIASRRKAVGTDHWPWTERIHSVNNISLNGCYTPARTS